MSEFSLWLQHQMDRRGIRAPQVAAYVDVSPSAVSRWLTGKGRPNTASCTKLAELFDEEVLTVLALAGHPVEYTPKPERPLTIRWSTRRSRSAR